MGYVTLRVVMSEKRCHTYTLHMKTVEKVAPDVGLEPTTLGLLELRWLASKSPMLYRLS